MKSNDHEDECTAEFTKIPAILEDQSIEPNFSNDNITNLLQNLNPQKTCGPDNLPDIMLNKCSESLANSLSVIFRTFSNKRCFPTFWKNSEVTQIFKDTDRSLVKKYRPISLLCNISKVWEKMMEKTIAEIFLPKVDPCQCGFVSKRSTLLKLLAYRDEIYRTLDSQTKFLATVYIDFATPKSCHHDDTKFMSSNQMELQEDLDRFVQWCDQKKWKSMLKKAIWWCSAAVTPKNSEGRT